MIHFRVARRLAVTAFSLLVIASAIGGAYAQDKYPTRPITFIVPFAAGGPTDILARLIGQSVGLTLGQQVVVEDVTGAGGTTSARAARRARRLYLRHGQSRYACREPRHLPEPALRPA